MEIVVDVLSVIIIVGGIITVYFVKQQIEYIRDRDL